MNDTVLNKRAIIERCMSQVRGYYALETGTPFDRDYLCQDAIAMNLQRICEAAIDIANHWVRVEKLGIPQDGADAFGMLYRANSITPELRAAMHGMVGFRNVLVHRCRDLDMSIMRRVIEHHLGEPLTFANRALAALS